MFSSDGSPRPERVVESTRIQLTSEPEDAARNGQLVTVGDWVGGSRGGAREAAAPPPDPIDDAARSLKVQILVRVDEDGEGDAGHAQVADGPSSHHWPAMANPPFIFPPVAK